MATVTLIHAVVPALAPMERALQDAIPGVRVRHLLDEGLSSEAARRGGVDRECVARMLTLIELAVAAQTDAILLTCTAYSTMLPKARERFPGLPLLAVDEVMVATAVARATRIGVLATFGPGLEQQRELLERQSLRMGKPIEIIESLQAAAMEALRAGDAAEHDRIVLDALPSLAARSEVVLLAQASMARVEDRVPGELRERVLSSPRLAAESLRETLFAQIGAEGAAS